MTSAGRQPPVLTSAALCAREADPGAMLRDTIRHLLADPGVADRVSHNLQRASATQDPPAAFGVRAFLDASDGGLRGTTGLSQAGSALWAAVSRGVAGHV